MRTVLFISPHFDDAAFSCGGTVARMARTGWRVVVATVFTASVPEPKGFALACQLDKGLPAHVDYMAIRRREDRDWADAVGVTELAWLPFAEAPHRGYESAAELFAGEKPGDDIEHAVADALTQFADYLKPDAVFGPQGLGNHVDHLKVIRAMLAVPAFAGKVAWWRDVPYAIRHPSATPSDRLPPGLPPFTVDVTEEGESAAQRGAACYRTQIGFQFGGEAELYAKLTAFRARASILGGTDGPAERFLGVRPPGL
jgi:LmbE family N-acetylglucosaminyl deacetylase